MPCVNSCAGQLSDLSRMPSGPGGGHETEAIVDGAAAAGRKKKKKKKRWNFRVEGILGNMFH